MSDMKRVNPALMLEAAKMAIPNMDWYIADYTKRVIHNDALEEPIVVFDPLQDDSDAWALERALKKEGWQFRFQCGCYWARNDWRRGEGKYLDAIGDDSDTLLLLKCVSAMTGIELYV